MSDSELNEQPRGGEGEAYHQLPGGPNTDVPRKRNPRNPKPRADYWSDIQELRGKLAEHEEMMGKLRSAFSMIAVALDITPRTMELESHEPAHRPPRFDRRNGTNPFYKNNNRGGGHRSFRGHAPGFRPN
jgi:hypothetical protein